MVLGLDGITTHCTIICVVFACVTKCIMFYFDCTSKVVSIREGIKEMEKLLYNRGMGSRLPGSSLFFLPKNACFLLQGGGGLNFFHFIIPSLIWNLCHKSKMMLYSVPDVLKNKACLLAIFHY